MVVRRPRCPPPLDPHALRRLVVRLRDAEGPDRDLDAQIDTLVNRIAWRLYRDDAQQLWGHGPDGRIIRHGVKSCPAVTASLDAAHALLRQALPGWSWQVHTEARQEDGFRAAVWCARGASAYRRHVSQAMPTPALAVAFAVLAALLNDPPALDAR